MKTRFVVLGAVALMVVMALAAACGGDGGGGEEAGIRTEKGLAVAALAAGAQSVDETDGRGGEASATPGAPSTDAAVGVERGGAIAPAPDIAPFPFPSLQEGQTGITVQGYGSASVGADSALLELYFSGKFLDDIGLLPEPGGTEPAPRSFESIGELEDFFADRLEAQEITEADLQPVVDAIADQGVSRADIEVIVEPSYGEPYYGGSAIIRVTVDNADALEDIVDAATEAASGLEEISFGGSSVSYTVSDCASLERAAMEAAVEDARERGQNFASVLGVGLGPVEGASSYSSSSFGGSPCDSSFGGPYPLGGVAFAEGQSSEVQLVATVTITFAIQ